jgi:hypothetical protein
MKKILVYICFFKINRLIISKSSARGWKSISPNPCVPRVVLLGASGTLDCEALQRPVGCWGCALEGDCGSPVSQPVCFLPLMLVVFSATHPCNDVPSSSAGQGNGAAQSWTRTSRTMSQNKCFLIKVYCLIISL